MQIVHLRTNHLCNPLGYRLSHVVFSWVVEGAQGTKATESRIVVTNGSTTIADTGWAQLDSRQRCP